MNFLIKKRKIESFYSQKYNFIFLHDERNVEVRR